MSVILDIHIDIDVLDENYQHINVGFSGWGRKTQIKTNRPVDFINEIEKLIEKYKVDD